MKIHECYSYHMPYKTSSGHETPSEKNYCLLRLATIMGQAIIIA